MPLDQPRPAKLNLSRKIAQVVATSPDAAVLTEAAKSLQPPIAASVHSSK